MQLKPVLRYAVCVKSMYVVAEKIFVEYEYTSMTV